MDASTSGGYTSAPAPSSKSSKTKSAATSEGNQGGAPKKAATRIVMTWNENKDLALLKEVASINPFLYRRGSKERGKCWTEVAEVLQVQGFKVDQRAVRDRYNFLQGRNLKKNREERSASGIAPEDNEVQGEIIAILEDLHQQDEQSDAGPTRNEEEQKKIDGTEMRKRLVESFGETSRRLKDEDGERETKRRRNSGTDVASFMKMKLEMEREARAQELQLRKDEAAQRELREQREEERRRQEEAEKERKEAERQRKEDERDRRFELLQQQILQQSSQMNNMLMLMMKQQGSVDKKEEKK